MLGSPILVLGQVILLTTKPTHICLSNYRPLLCVRRCRVHSIVFTCVCVSNRFNSIINDYKSSCSCSRACTTGHLCWCSIEPINSVSPWDALLRTRALDLDGSGFACTDNGSPDIPGPRGLLMHVIGSRRLSESVSAAWVRVISNLCTHLCTHLADGKQRWAGIPCTGGIVGFDVKRGTVIAPLCVGVARAQRDDGVSDIAVQVAGQVSLLTPSLPRLQPDSTAASDPFTIRWVRCR